MDKNQGKSVIEKYANKVEIYMLFANIYAKEPTVEFLELLKRKENEFIFESLKVDCLSDIKKVSLKKQAELLSIEYAKLFLAPSRLASPYESIQRGEERLWGDYTVKVNELYIKFGFKVDDSFKETPDHLSAELSFLAKLSELNAGYNRKGLKEERKGVLQVKKYFLKKHLLQWFPLFIDNVNKYSDYSYYKEMTKLLSLVLDDDMNSLKDINDIQE